ncbi:transposase [Rugamonas apoptosis]|uniref:Transposase n=1 Tax=Rugamonas apoptosis TaxID=2758570 RepID=A0A7W2IKF0_9BURK|nr:transposase [Rugamonas apoptosis]MBA5687469.1 transposase [Rugamonas apoptosis]
MNRPLRIEFEHALYHVTARGDRQDSIFRSDSDRLVWLTLLGETCERFNFEVRAYCQMTNHFHLLLETVSGELARGMRHLNGTYSRYFNRTHGLIGHVFQGRYKAILCQHETYLLELSRYIELNPVRARMVALPNEWPWSSYQATIGLVDSPPWLRSALLLMQFGGKQLEARLSYKEFVLAGIGGINPLSKVSNQMLLGDGDFRASVIGIQPPGDLREIKRTQRRAIALPLAKYFAAYRDPKEAMARAYYSLGYSMREIAQHARVSIKTVSRVVAGFKLD